MRIYLSFLLIIIFIACGGGGGIPSDKFDNNNYILYAKGETFIARKGDSIISKTLNTQISVTRNMTNEESSITVILGSVSFLHVK
jgi:hypothetical protein